MSELQFSTNDLYFILFNELGNMYRKKMYSILNFGNTGQFIFGVRPDTVTRETYILATNSMIIFIYCIGNGVLN